MKIFPRGRALTLWLPLGLVKLLLLIAALLVGQVASAQDRWPREITTKEGKVVIYQPQLESFQGDKATVLAAVSVQKTNMKAPVFGVVWFESRIATDRDQRMVEFQEIKVTQTKTVTTGRGQKPARNPASPASKLLWTGTSAPARGGPKGLRISSGRAGVVSAEAGLAGSVGAAAGLAGVAGGGES